MLKEMFKDFFLDKTKVLFSILIMTLVVLPITYSRYINQEQGRTMTKLAKWEVSLFGNDNEEFEFVLENNVNQIDYQFTITNTSEVASDYSIKLSNIPLGFILKIDNDQIYYPVNGIISVENLGGFELNTINASHEHILSFILNSDIVTTDGIELDLQVDIKQRILSGVDN